MPDVHDPNIGKIQDYSFSRVSTTRYKLTTPIVGDGLGGVARIWLRGQTHKPGAQIVHEYWLLNGFSFEVDTRGLVPGQILETELDIEALRINPITGTIAPPIAVGDTTVSKIMTYRQDPTTGAKTFGHKWPGDNSGVGDGYLYTWPDPTVPPTPPPAVPAPGQFSLEVEAAGDSILVRWTALGPEFHTDYRFGPVGSEWLAKPYRVRLTGAPGQARTDRVMVPPMAAGVSIEAQAQNIRLADGIVSAISSAVVATYAPPPPPPSPPEEPEPEPEPDPPLPEPEPEPEPAPGVTFPATGAARFPTNLDEFYLDRPDGVTLKFGRLWKWLSFGWFGTWGVYLGKPED